MNPEIDPKYAQMFFFFFLQKAEEFSGGKIAFAANGGGKMIGKKQLDLNLIHSLHQKKKERKSQKWITDFNIKSKMI